MSDGYVLVEGGQRLADMTEQQQIEYALRQSRLEDDRRREQEQAAGARYVDPKPEVPAAMPQGSVSVRVTKVDGALGLRWENSSNVLCGVQPGSSGEQAGLQEYLGRRLIAVNDKLVQPDGVGRACAEAGQHVLLTFEGTPTPPRQSDGVDVDAAGGGLFQAGKEKAKEIYDRSRPLWGDRSTAHVPLAPSADVSAEFQAAVQAVSAEIEHQPQAMQYKLFGLYKQATEGDFVPAGGLVSMPTAKRNEWLEHRGMPRAEAQKKYVELVARISGAYGDSQPQPAPTAPPAERPLPLPFGAQPYSAEAAAAREAQKEQSRQERSVALCSAAFELRGEMQSRVDVLRGMLGELERAREVFERLPMEVKDHLSQCRSEEVQALSETPQVGPSTLCIAVLGAPNSGKTWMIRGLTGEAIAPRNWAGTVQLLNGATADGRASVALVSAGMQLGGKEFEIEAKPGHRVAATQRAVAEMMQETGMSPQGAEHLTLTITHPLQNLPPRTMIQEIRCPVGRLTTTLAALPASTLAVVLLNDLPPTTAAELAEVARARGIGAITVSAKADESVVCEEATFKVSAKTAVATQMVMTASTMAGFGLPLDGPADSGDFGAVLEICEEQVQTAALVDEANRLEERVAQLQESKAALRTLIEHHCDDWVTAKQLWSF
eukprot:TRINITY_DN7936_c0_g1_i1.p1 TRINITY_DN7936_c0_g1~~TRINITY_DN7936_c0_g1_i1.p1  ORF type:complete len:689 (+),score=210.47 TRINITY_DN7936_c0_g1_i1:85-2067(+)